MTVEVPERIEIEEEHVRDRFSRAVAVAIVLVTLLVAVAHFLQSSNEEKAADAAVNAQKLTIVANNQQATALQDASTQLGLVALSEEQRTRQANALQQQFNEIANNAIDDTETARVTQEYQRWLDLAAASERRSSLKSDGPQGPQMDPQFPAQFLNDQLTELDKLRAERDALNQEGQDWNNKVTAYAAVLTLTAVALYLLGLSIALKVRVRLGLAGLGAGLAVIAVIASTVIQATPPTPPPSQAADEFAEGLKEFNNASATSDIEGFKSSAQHLRRATELRPRFALAFEKLAGAELAAGAPTPSAIGVAPPSDDALKRGEAALKKAMDLGDSSFAVLVDYGAVQYDFWLVDGQKSRLDAAVKYQRQAQALDSANPVPPANLAVGLLAMGQDSAARAAARETIVRLLKFNNSFATEYYVAGTLSSLETLLKARPDTAGHVQAMKEYLTDAAANANPDPPSGANRTADNTEINVNAGLMEWSANIAGFQQGRDHVSVQWYSRDPGKVAWTTLPAASGTFTQLPVASFRGPNGYGDRKPSPAPPGQCLHDGTYRMEIYINGRLAGKAEQDYTLGDLRGHRLQDIGATVCVPQDWKPSKDSIRGFENGYVSPSKDAGVLFFRYQDAAVGGSADLRARSTKYLELTMLAFKPQFPAPPQFVGRPSYQFFMTLDGSDIQRYSYPGGEVRVGAGVSRVDGSLLVGIVYGPTSTFLGGGMSPAMFNALVESF